MGEFNGWKGQSMTKGNDGIWTARISLGAGTYGYKFFVNGTDWILDPENLKKKSMTLAADVVEAEKNKEGSNRGPCVAAAFDYLTAAWPAIRDWPVASAGMSGGGKNGAFLAAELAREHHRLIGMLMMGCNQDMASVAYRKSAPPNFLNATIFLSSGKSDKIATPEQHEYVKNSLKGTGFYKVRLENFDGAHDIYQPHIGEALR